MRKKNPDGGPSGLTRVTVNLTPEAWAALQKLKGAGDRNLTDTINRSLGVLAVLEELVSEGSGVRKITILNEDGSTDTICL